MGLCLIWASVTKSGLSPADGRTSIGVETHRHQETPEPSLAKNHIIFAYNMHIRDALLSTSDSVAY